MITAAEALQLSRTLDLDQRWAQRDQEVVVRVPAPCSGPSGQLMKLHQGGQRIIDRCNKNGDGSPSNGKTLEPIWADGNQDGRITVEEYSMDDGEREKVTTTISMNYSPHLNHSLPL